MSFSCSWVKCPGWRDGGLAGEKDAVEDIVLPHFLHFLEVFKHGLVLDCNDPSMH